MISARANSGPQISSGQSIRLVEVTAVLACAFGAAVLIWQFFRFLVVFPGAALLALGLEVPLLAVGFMVLRRLRPVRPPPMIWSGAALVWGATAAAGCALLANRGLIGLWAKGAGTRFAADWSASLSAPLNEEILKLCGVVMVLLAAPAVIQGPLDGLIIGALVGLGFQATENVTYGLNNIVLSGATDAARAVFDSFAIRVGVTALGSHWTMSAVAGAGVGYLAARRRGAEHGSVLAAVACLLTAIAMHLIFDAPSIAEVVKVGLNFVIVLTVYLLLTSAYLTRARWALADGVATRSISEREAASLLNRRRRRDELHRTTGTERELLAARQASHLTDVDREAA
jgi:RsiW-degrading membrane proteinase PrsW (M82 family)